MQILRLRAGTIIVPTGANLAADFRPSRLELRQRGALLFVLKEPRRSPIYIESIGFILLMGGSPTEASLCARR